MISWWIGCDCISFLRPPKQITMTGWLKATEIYSLTVLETRSPNSRVSRASLRALPCLIQLEGRQLFFGSCQPDSSLCLCVHMAFSPVSVLPFSYKHAGYCMLWKWKALSHVQLFMTPWTIQSMQFSRPEYWSEELFPSPGDLPNPGIKPKSLALQVDSLLAEHVGPTLNPQWSHLKVLEGLDPISK